MLDSNKNLNEASLEGVAGGNEPIWITLEFWEEIMRAAGYQIDEYLDGSNDIGFYYRVYNPRDKMPFKDEYKPRRNESTGKIEMPLYLD